MANNLNARWYNNVLALYPPNHTGIAYYVDATNGASTNQGLSWTDALATVDQAIAKCTANTGNKIYMAPWHAESETTAAAAIVTMSKAGIDLIGLRQGNSRPTFTIGAADATFSVTAGNCRISNIKIISDIADCAVGMTVGASADGLQVDNCIFTDGALAKELVIGIQLAAACDGCKILDNEFYSDTTGTGGCASAIKLVGESVKTIIAGNTAHGDYSVATLDAGTAKTTMLTVQDNDFCNIDTTAGAVIKLHNTTTGFVVRNTLGGAKTAGGIAACFAGGACYTAFNYSTGAVSAKMVQQNNAITSAWLNGEAVLYPPDAIGTVYYVDATNGNANNSGLDWQNALAAVDEAIAKCSDNVGDKIYCAPWHAESEATTGPILTMDIEGVDLIGVVQGNQRPTFTLAHADAEISVTDANCRISGIKIVASVANVKAGIVAGASADGLQVDHCIITDGENAAKELIVGIQLTAACDGCKFLDNEFYTWPGGACNSGIKLVGESVKTVIARNNFHGDYAVSAIDGSTAASTLLTIMGNTMVNVDDGAGCLVKLHTDTTGSVARNVWANPNAMASAFTGAACYANWNYSVGAVDKSGILEEPGADAD
jgi:hypothetical protein